MAQPGKQNKHLGKKQFTKHTQEKKISVSEVEEAARDGQDT